MKNKIQSISLEKLIAHPDNPNRQSKTNFRKLVRNIERSGQYEPLVVRPHPRQAERFQIINGHHRRDALMQLGHSYADCLVWDIDDEQTDILLATLNRLNGSDVLEKKLHLLKRLNDRFKTKQLAKLLPQTAKQIKQLTQLKMPTAVVKADTEDFATPLVFFVDNDQRQVIEKALSFAAEPNSKQPKAAQRAEALAAMAQNFINHSQGNTNAHEKR